MTRLEKHLVVACSAIVTVGVLAVRAMLVQPAPAKTAGTEPTPMGQSSDPGPAPVSPSAPTSPSPADTDAKSSAVPAAVDTYVGDHVRNELLKLSGLVNLAASPYTPPDKDQWRQAVSVAKELVQGSCDCVQRSWLKTFVEMGDFALAGDEENYRKLGEIMVTLGRSNDESAAFFKEQHDLAEQREQQRAAVEGDQTTTL